MLTQLTRLRLTAPAASYPPTMTGGRPTPLTPICGVQELFAMPFDALRVQYASAVKVGLAPRSLLASGNLERRLDAMEKLILGPLARQR